MLGVKREFLRKRRVLRVKMAVTNIWKKSSFH